MNTPTDLSVLAERLGESLFVLSGKLLTSGFFEDEQNHAAYEKVVAAFTALRSQENSSGR